ncbi:UNVERIFIED_CONTAM: hypothetical protein GTU68_060722 [Idotea baltica]|nr:hypothetical protein [Idotea baltica]
MILNTVVKF